MDLQHALQGGGTDEEGARLNDLRFQEAVELGPDFEPDNVLWMQDDELLSLWHMFKTHPEWTGIRPTMRDFGAWLAGADYRTTLFSTNEGNNEPAVVTW